MKRKDYIKKGGLIIFSASYLLSNVGVALAKDYQLNNSVQVYKEAQEAKNRAKTNKTLPKGMYHIYKKHDGMLNITKVEGEAGGWINPVDNISLSKSTDKQDDSNWYVLENAVQAFMDSDDAKSGKNPITVYESGEYYVYKSYNGMLNITKVEGQAGGWINPSKNIVSSDLETQDKFILSKDTKGYMDSFDAKDEKNSIMNVSKGNYFIYKKYNGMLNITKDEAIAGVWINPNNLNNRIENSPKPTNDNKREILTYRLKTDTKGYVNSIDAKEKVNSIRNVEKGNYYIFKSYNSMLNITKEAYEAGIWINPSDNFNYTQKQQMTKNESSIKEDLSFNKAVDKFIDNEISEDDLEKLDYNKEEITKSAIDKIAKSSKLDLVKVKVAEMETVKEKETEEDIKENTTVKEVPKETIKETETETSEEIDKEPNTKEETIEEVKEKETSDETVKETEKEDDSENEDSIFSKTFELKEKANGYLSIDDAISTQNSINVLSEGVYFIYQEDNSMINITTIKGKPGLWINPQKLFVESKSDEKIKEGESYQLIEEVDGYNRATDAINEQNVATKLAPGDYFIYKVESGVINLSKDSSQPGIWVNLN
ncbi:hypothetical protein ACKA04_01820 [Helcococcus kunzii]|uniref:hypothetical protein n=1 Tax=Helcococcus kunzii TaxID=40091 RepID=UPI0038AE4305